VIGSVSSVGFGFLFALCLVTVRSYLPVHLVRFLFACGPKDSFHGSQYTDRYVSVFVTVHAIIAPGFGLLLVPSEISWHFLVRLPPFTYLLPK
jgi:hypothetical protein